MESGFYQENGGIDMYLIKEDSYTCPFCGCVVEREELS